MSINQKYLQGLCSQLAAAADDLSCLDEDNLHSKSRQDILALSREIFNHTLLPKEEWTERLGIVCTMSATVLFIKWGVFDAIPVEGQASFEDLAKAANADPSLTRRIGRVLIGNNVLKQIDDEHVGHTLKSLAYLKSNNYSYLTDMAWDGILKSCAFLPEYFEWSSRVEPQGMIGCPYTYAFGKPEASLWEIMYEEPGRMRAFMNSMDTVETFMPSTPEYNLGWVQEAMSKDTSRVLFVDVGGGKGHLVQAICDKNKWLPRNRCIVQDRDEVVQNASTSNNAALKEVNFMAHNFRDTQPVKGALVYHIRRCIHDYGDEVCIRILGHLSDAMASDSRLFLVEQIISSPPSRLEAETDFSLMTLGGKERSMHEFEHLVEKSGLKIFNIQTKPNAPIAVIECVKA